MEVIDDFEVLEDAEYSNFDQSTDRELNLARVLNIFAADETGNAERRHRSIRTGIGRNFYFRGTKFKDLLGDEFDASHVAYSSSRILGQFKVETGYLLIVDCDSTQRVVRLPGVDFMYGKPHIGVLFLTDELRYVGSHWLCGRCIQRRFGFRRLRHQKIERFNPVLDWIIVDDWTVDVRLLGRAWIRISVQEYPPKGYRPLWGYPYQAMPGRRGPHYFSIRPCFRVQRLNDATFWSAINYFLRGAMLIHALRP